MTWNYRVLHEETEVPGVGMESTFSIVEVYYDTDGTTITSWVDAKIHPEGITLDELAADLARMVAAITKPVVRREDLPGG